jgi:hypothetical protein
MTTLVPNTGSSWHPVATITQRAASEFMCVVTDQKRAMKRLANKLVAEDRDVDQKTADEYLQPLAESVEMICADDRHADEQFLKCYVVPEQPIEIVYHFEGHEEVAGSLIVRLARVLDYAIID